jgi:hypothetical protein
MIPKVQTVTTGEPIEFTGWWTRVRVTSGSNETLMQTLNIFRLPSYQWRWSMYHQRYCWHRLHVLRKREYGGASWEWHWVSEAK